MALKGLRSKAERATDVLEARKPLIAEAPAPRSVSPSTSIDSTTVFVGSLQCKHVLRIDGCLEGEVECEKAVLVGEGARIHATIAGDELQVAGCVEGDITARRKITLKRTAVVTGDLSTPGIVVEEGAQLQGRIVIGKDAEPDRPAKPSRGAKRVEKSSATTAGRSSEEIPASQPAASTA